MAKQHLILGLVLGGCFAAVACSSDSDDSAGAGGSGGTHATAGTSSGGSAGKASGGSAGKASGGSSAGGSDNAAGTGGSVSNAGASEGGTPGNGETGEGGEAGAPVVVVPPPPPPPLNPHFVLVPSAPVAAAHALVAGTDYSTTEVTSITLQPAAVGNTHVYADGDSVAVSSAGLGFVLERTNDVVNQIDDGQVKTAFDLHDLGTATAPLADNKAYVGLYGTSAVAILDLAANKVSRRIDLSAFNVASDSDGSVDLTSAAYDSTKHIAYLVLSRIDRNAISADPLYHLHCTSTHALVVGIDTTTDQVVDINGAGEGDALELSLVAPTSATLDATGKTLTVLADGCYDGATLTKQGVEALDLVERTSKVEYTPTGADFFENLIVLGGSDALILSSDENFVDHWHKLNLATGTLGAELLNVPDGATFDGTDLVGVKVTGKVGSLQRYVIATDTATQITATTWSGQYGTVSGVALVK